MKTVVILSGKGGAGKTSVTAGLAPFTKKTLFADADVNAANLSIWLKSSQVSEEKVSTEKIAIINADACTGCDACIDVCRFDALTHVDDPSPLVVVDELSCEGCAVCTLVCPTDAITMGSAFTGQIFESTTRFGHLVHAELGAGGESSGNVVEMVRSRAASRARDQDAELILVDGPPGMGCPVNSAITGVDLAVVVVEPTPGGIADSARVIELAAHFRVPVAIVLNKTDLHPERVKELEADFKQRDIPVLGRLPYDEAVFGALRSGTLLSELNDHWKQRMQGIWSALTEQLEKQ